MRTKGVVSSCVRIPEELWEEVHIIAIRKRISYSELIRLALYDYIKTIKSVSDDVDLLKK